jgi:hypothetical protein
MGILDLISRMRAKPAVQVNRKNPRLLQDTPDRQLNRGETPKNLFQGLTFGNNIQPYTHRVQPKGLQMGGIVRRVQNDFGEDMETELRQYPPFYEDGSGGRNYPQVDPYIKPQTQSRWRSF